MYTFPNSAPTSGGTVQLELFPSSSSGHNPNSGITPISQDTPVQNTTHECFGGTFQLGRLMNATLTNSGTGQSISNAWVMIEIFQES